jgi:hypothetical protein
VDCANKAWVPYDASISPMENLFDKATDLDPQPEFRLRTKFDYFVGQEAQSDRYLISGHDGVLEQQGLQNAITLTPEKKANGSLSITMVAFLWILGLCVWCVFFANQGGPRSTKRRGAKKLGSSKSV